MGRTSDAEAASEADSWLGVGAGGEAEFEERAAGRAAADARAVVDTLRRARGRDYTSDSGASEAVRPPCLAGAACAAAGACAWHSNMMRRARGRHYTIDGAAGRAGD